MENEEIKQTEEQEVLNNQEPATEGNNTAADEEQTVEEQLTAQIEELKSQLLYKQAEFENYRRRVIKEKAELLLNGAEKTVLAMLPVVDDLERALANMQKAADVDAVREGVELISQKFVKALEGLGVKAIETNGANFSTDQHEAIAQIPAPSDELKGKVLDCVQTGYMLNDKVIRFAKVAVGV